MKEINFAAQIGQFEAKALEQQIDSHQAVAVWTDGITLLADNGKTPLMPGKAPCAFTLEPGKQYRVTVEEVTTSDKITTDMLISAQDAHEAASKHYKELLNEYAKQECPFTAGQTVEPFTLSFIQKTPAVIEEVHGAYAIGGRSYGWVVQCRILTATGKERKYKLREKFRQEQYESTLPKSEKAAQL